jgi:UDP-glucuronate 4-epimerase
MVNRSAAADGRVMRALVTGVAGFIGSHTAERLLARGWRVVGIDNFDPFYVRERKEQNLERLRAEPSFCFEEVDIRDASGLERTFAKAGPLDAVVHLAARAGVRPSIADPSGYTTVNINGTVNLLECATKQEPLPRFVFASSSSVYGNAPEVPFSETDRVDCPISPYAATKKAGELICHSYHYLTGLPVFCLRLFTVFGPRQRPDLAIQKFAEKIVRGEPIEMYGLGETSRDYTFVDDATAGICAAVDRCAGFEIINLGSNRPITLREMIDAVSRACGRKAEIVQLPMQPGDVTRTYADVSKAERVLGYRPQVSFSEGLARQVEALSHAFDDR